MIPPEKPDNEEERLKTLYSLNILDTDQEERFNRITRIACKLFNVPIAVISFMEAERQWMKATEGLDIKEAKRNTSFCGHVIHDDTLLVIEDARNDVRFHDNPFVVKDPKFRFYVGCPIKIKDCNVGVLCLIDNKPRSVQDVDEGVVNDLTGMVQLELEALHLSTTDELTGLSNRRGFIKIGKYLFEMCRRENKPFSILFFDLNKFKHINDTFGHAEGDNVLKVFANALMTHFRKYDLVARLGGDEFCVLCTGLDKNGVEKAVTRLREYLDAIRNKNYDISFSVGCVEFDKEKQQSLEQMLEKADAKMYNEKNQR